MAQVNQTAPDLTIRWPSIPAIAFRASFGRVALFAWFVAMDAMYLQMGTAKVGVDAAIYTEASAAWLRGGDPYAVSIGGVPFGAAPPALLVYAPFTLLPEILVGPVWIAIGLAAGLWTLGRLDLPLWWLAFPPLATGIALGNAQPLVLALLLAGRGLPVFLAAALKLYGIVPPLVAGAWRSVAWAAVGLLLTAPLVPWGQFLAHGGYQERFTPLTLNGSALAFGPVVVAVTVVGLVILGRRSASWLAVPALWPATQTYYAVFALPTIRPWMAAILALPFGLVVPFAIVVAAIARILIARGVLSPVMAGTAS